MKLEVCFTGECKLAEVMFLKYEVVEGGWFSNSPKGSHRVGLWKDINKEVVHLQCNIAFNIGNDKRTKFWEDLWCSNLPLSIQFPSLCNGWF